MIYSFCYRLIMKIAHQHNWHHMKPCYPNGDTMLWCHWCGIRVVTHRHTDQLQEGQVALW